MKRKYLPVLKELGGTEPWLAAAEKYRGDTLKECTALVSAPVIYLYARHILSRAETLGIKRLYFLARDGYTVMRAAEEISAKENIPVKMSYFYCSRYSLRMAAYRFRDSSAYDRLFYEGYELSAKKLLLRAGFTDAEREKVYKDINAVYENEDMPLSRGEFSRLCIRIKNSRVFGEMLDQKSADAYENTLGYIVQEGMDREEHFGIVDIGWTGSMQLTLKRLLSHAGIKCRITGFYLGMLEAPPCIGECAYDCFLFEGRGDINVRSWFSHNLMECICTAPHGMTAGYEKNSGGIYVPVLSECENSPDMIKSLSDIIREFAREADIPRNEKNRDIALRLLKGLMYTPAPEEAEAFGRAFSFCDDVSEGYHRNIAEGADKTALSAGLLHRKILRKLSGSERSQGGLYWYCGSLALSDVSVKGFYRRAYRFSEGVRYFIKERKTKKQKRR